MRIGIFDSGIGGLTVLKKLIEKYPNSEYIYYGDTKNAPFGNKSIEELKVIATNIIDFLKEKKVDIIVIACGTISSNLKEYLRGKYDIPIYDIISGTINYINNSEYENIGVLCTEKTKDSKVYERLVNKKIKVIDCPKLATLIEKNETYEINNYIKKYIEKLKDKDLIVLGCTHYPLIIDTIKKYTNVDILNMADHISFKLITETNFKIDLYFSFMDNVILNNVNNILKKYNYEIKKANR